MSSENVTDRTRPSARAGVWLPLFDALSDPQAIVDLAVEAEETGWDGFFVWDHVNWRSPVRAVLDPWVPLAAVAAVTSRLLIGPMVTPLARRRPVRVARETAALDLLGDGRLILGVGVGSDRFGGEYSRTGEDNDEPTRAAMLDESLAILRQAWSGERVDHRGAHYTVDGLEFLPRPAQPTIPVWVAGFPGKSRPRRRAATQDGFFPVNLTHPDELAEAVAAITPLREDPTSPYDYVVALERETDPAPFIEAGATWILTDVDPRTLDLEAVRELVRAGPSIDSDRANGPAAGSIR